MSGVIYGAIVVMWLAFLVPMWLKRHDQAPEPKPVERATIAMRVLSRRTRAAHSEESPEIAGVDGSAPLSAGGEREVIAADSVGKSTRIKAGLGRLAHLKRHRPDGAAPDEPVAATTRSRQPVSAAARRRRILGTLVGLTVVLAVIAGIGRVPWLAVAPAAALLLAYLALLAVHGRGVHRARREESVEPAAPIAPRFVGNLQQGAVTQHAEDATTTLSTVAADHPADVEAAVVATSAPDGFAGPRLGWDPVPVPSPTYVRAPRAPRAVRSIDLSREGAWTSGRLVADAKAAAAAAVARSSETKDDSELARRAVGD